MRLQGVLWISVAAAVAACGNDPVRAPRGDGVMVLEVGGEQPSLRGTLLAAGRSVEPPRWLKPQPEVAPEPVPGSVPGGAELPQPQPQSPQQPVRQDTPQLPPDPAPPPVESEWVTVPLPNGETLIHVARRHLGDGRRFVELLEWNGWSDIDARRLAPDTPVRIKRSELRQR